MLTRLPFETFSQAIGTKKASATSNKKLCGTLRKIIQNDLTKKQKQYIIMYYSGQKNIPMIALETGVNRSTVSRTLKRARARIYERLKYYDFRSASDEYEYPDL